MPVTNAPTSAFAKEKGSNGKYTVTLIPGCVFFFFLDSSEMRA